PQPDAAARRTALAVTFRQTLGRDLPETAIAPDGGTATVAGLTFSLRTGDGGVLHLATRCPDCTLPMRAAIYSLAGLGHALGYLDRVHAPASPFTHDPKEPYPPQPYDTEGPD
ncbi:MAG: hypothetical protein M3Z04_13890, partial [Chloroflexota bacterium]|nr:hypothetical protein [Chloroflexota bacterium]